MALPKAYQAAFLPKEIEYLAGNEMIDIIPKYKMPSCRLLQLDVGPFRPPLKSSVPLWLALVMKKNQKCSLVPPDWLSVDTLKQRLKEEEEGAEFSALPFHYMEMAQMILEWASDDILNAEQVRKLLKDLRETRQSKARAGLKELDDKWLGMNNLSLMEINEIRPFFSRAFNEMHKLSSEEEQRRRSTYT